MRLTTGRKSENRSPLLGCVYVSVARLPAWVSWLRYWAPSGVPFHCSAPLFISWASGTPAAALAGDRGIKPRDKAHEPPGQIRLPLTQHSAVLCGHRAAFNYSLCLHLTLGWCSSVGRHRAWGSPENTWEGLKFSSHPLNEKHLRANLNSDIFHQRFAALLPTCNDLYCRSCLLDSVVPFQSFLHPVIWCRFSHGRL